jgi:PadR family transcriptional regulator PadR
MDTTQLLKGVLDLAVLAVVGERDGYGYDVVRRLREAGSTTWGTRRCTARCAGCSRLAR